MEGEWPKLRWVDCIQKGHERILFLEREISLGEQRFVQNDIFSGNRASSEEELKEDDD